MRDATAADKICDFLVKLLTEQRTILFAGAGVGVRAGLPDWPGFVEHLVGVAARYENETAAIMRVRKQAGLLADAISYYKFCRLIPEGEKFRELASPFEDRKSDSDALRMLAALPFEAIVTTNYDRSLDHAWAAVHRKAPRTFELDDGSLKQAAFSTDFYIARIHGRALKRESMIASAEDFAELDANNYYKDFLIQNILTRRNCLFVGYSFLDPAINKVLQLLEKQMSPTYPRLHHALLPADASELSARLAHFNIRVITYPDHIALWDCVESLPSRLVGVTKAVQEPTKYPLPYDQMRIFLANLLRAINDVKGSSPPPRASDACGIIKLN